MTNELRNTPDGTTGRTARRSGRLILVVAAAAVVLLQWTCDELWADTELAVRQGGGVQHVGAVAVTVTALLAGFAAWGLLALLERTTRRPALIYRIIATLVLLLSLAGPLGAGVDLHSTMLLLTMHTTVGAALIIGLPGRRRR